MNKTRYILLLLLIIIAPNIVFSHEDNASRVEFWKKYYNPKIENDRSEVPSIDIELKKIGSHYQLRTVVNNFAFTPCLLYTSPSPRDKRQSRMPSSA